MKCVTIYTIYKDIRNLSVLFQKFMLTVNIGCGTRLGYLSKCKFRFYMINMPLQKKVFYALQRDYIQNGTHHSGIWGCQEGLNPKCQSLCSKNEATQAPTPPQNMPLNTKFVILWWGRGLRRFIFPTMVRAILDIILL